MKSIKQIGCLAGFIAASLTVCFVGRIFYIWRHIPEAYAAWDAGDMMIWYMKTHDNRWPQNWQELAAAIESEPNLRLRGRHPSEPDYLARMHKTIAIDWNFNPNHPVNPCPITRADGAPLHAYWEDPNRMIYQYINQTKQDGK